MNAPRILASALMLALFLAAGPAHGQGKGSETKVKASAKATKSGLKTTVTVTLDVDPTWYIYANPVGNDDLAANQTVVTFTAGGKKVDAEVKYPAGEVKKDATVGDYRIYKGKVTITATVDAGAALEAQIKVSSCNEKGLCLLPGTVKLKVE